MRFGVHVNVIIFYTELNFFVSHSLGNFITTAEKIRLPDDCTVGYIIEALLEVPLTHTGLFHSHLENLQRLPTDSILTQVRSLGGPWATRVGILQMFSITFSRDTASLISTVTLIYMSALCIIFDMQISKASK